MPPATSSQPAPSQAASAPEAAPNHSTTGDPLAAHADRWHRESLLVATVFVVAFISGYATSLLWHRDRVNREADQKAKVFLAEAIRQRILVVDHDRIAKIERLLADGQPAQPSR
ncbi:MAG: hypothetical protein ACOYOU_03070 [Kiritimatiellia bacterium]